MVTQRWRPVFISALAIIAIWILAIIGFNVAKNSRFTAEKVRGYVESVDLSKLTSAQRDRAIQKLANKLNSLPPEERRRAQLERIAQPWFDQMTEAERSKFLEMTMPAGFKQMLTAFEQLPEEQRRRTIDDTLRRLRESKARIQAGEGVGTNGPPPVSKDLQAKIRTMGLEAFYSQSSPQAKAELAPILEEMQRVMESGRPFRGR
jgi:hypothetical protein